MLYRKILHNARGGETCKSCRELGVTLESLRQCIFYVCNDRESFELCHDCESFELFDN